MRILKNTGDKKDYFSYMLRVWRDSSGGRTTSVKDTVWRASLQDPRSGERLGFNNLEELFSFLQRQVGLDLQGKDDPGDERG